MTAADAGTHVHSDRATNWPAQAVGAALMVPLAVMAVPAIGAWASARFLVPVLLMLAVIAFNLATASSMRTLVGPRGVLVSFGVFGWPRFRYPLERIASARVVTIPSAMWMWGIWWTPWGGLRLTLRGGPALELTLTNGRRVTVSADDPQAAVAAISANSGAPAP